jgi:hypothetical protein
MAREDDKYKAGVDFEWVPAKDGKGNIIKDGKGNPVKTRRFFKKAEKEAMKAPKAAPKKVEAPKAKKKAEAPVTKDAMKGYRKGDVTSSPLPSSIASATRKVLAETKPKESVGRTSMKVPKGITYEQWKGMTRTERREANLPVSAIGGELAFNRFLSGITGKDYKVGGEAEVKKPKLTTRIDWGTYSKGGMTQGKK